MNTQPVNVTEMLSGEVPAPAATDNAAASIQLADYELQHKLGSGGYGEVWRAIGPGGLPKAVKILYGERTGEHAESEMKALERMRDLRHPFLLSIERIEVIDSRLIVVTELADGNLTDRFTTCRNEGRKGIPREELLGYLRDSADALDFMYEQQGLQHLDIKPDNILLQGNHAKVGDFGLAKDLNATNVSIVNGFTPLYAAPELFEGRPGRATDQYSLAIVYQAMLTGKPPFSGRTAAQLTAQHLRSQPDLTDLQPIDRPVIARALSKNTNSRYDSCRQFIDELSRRRHARSTAAPVAADLIADTPVQTDLVKTRGTSGVGSAVETESTPARTTPVASENAGLRPAIVIGVGGLGGAVACDVKNLQSLEQPDSDNPIPVLAIDSSKHALTELRADADHPGLDFEETISIPLRSSKEYRKASDLDLSWLSRRWLFNIPRSCEVDGIRPLGRLALYDHRAVVRERIATLLDEASTDAAAQRLRTRTGLPAESGVDVYLVGAVSGGTASGILNDLGLMVTQIAREKKLSDVRVHGVLMHATGVARKAVDVQEANTASMIRELHHLSTPGLNTRRGFDNDSATRALAPFDEKYFVHLGDNLSDFDFAGQTQNVAQMLLQLTTTATQADFRSWQLKDETEFVGMDAIRILGFGTQDAESFAAASRESDGLAGAVLAHWLTPTNRDDPDFQTHVNGALAHVEGLMTELSLTKDAQTRQVMQILRGDIGKEIEAYANLVNQALIKQVDPEIVTHNELLDAISVFLSAQTPVEGAKTLHQIVGDVQKNLASRTSHCEQTLLTAVRNELNSPQRLKSTEVVAGFVKSNLLQTREHCHDLLKEIERAFQDLVAVENGDSRFAQPSQMLPIEQVMAFGQQYCVLLSYQTVYQCFLHHLDSLAGSVSALLSEMACLKAACPHQGAGSENGSDRDSAPQEIIDAFDHYLRSSQPGLLADNLSGDDAATRIRSRLADAAIQFLVSASGGQEPSCDQGRAFPQNAWPVVRKLGGQRRVIATLPEHVQQSDWTARLQAEFGDCVATRVTASGRMSALCQIEGVPLASVFAKLTHDNPHIAEVASRVHTRNDVDW